MASSQLHDKLDKAAKLSTNNLLESYLDFMIVQNKPKNDGAIINPTEENDSASNSTASTPEKTTDNKTIIEQADDVSIPPTPVSAQANPTPDKLSSKTFIIDGVSYTDKRYCTYQCHVHYIDKADKNKLHGQLHIESEGGYSILTYNHGINTYARIIKGNVETKATFNNKGNALTEVAMRYGSIVYELQNDNGLTSYLAVYDRSGNLLGVYIRGKHHVTFTCCKFEANDEIMKFINYHCRHHVMTENGDGTYLLTAETRRGEGYSSAILKYVFNLNSISLPV